MSDLSPSPPASVPAPVSVYDISSRRRKYLILLCSSLISLLTPFTDTVYLPVLNAVQNDFGASHDAVAATVSVYMACVGIFSLLWGPLSDRYGRRLPIILGLILFIFVSVGCLYAPTVDALIGLRALQGAVVGSTVTVSQGIVADTFAPHERGNAMGWFLVPMLLGPIIGPIVGGILGATYGWRSLFTLLTLMGTAIFLLSLFLPESLHWLVAKLYRQRHALPLPSSVDEEIRSNQELFTEGIHIHPPLLHSPWSPLAFLIEPQLAPYVAVGAVSFSTMFVALTTFPIYLHNSPYNLSESIIGLCYICIGVTLLLGVRIGGRLSDIYARKLGTHKNVPPQARLVPSLLGAYCLPLGCLVYGLSVHYEVSLAGVLIGHALIGFGQAMFGPGSMAFISSVKQRFAAGAAAASMALNFAIAGILISAAVPLQDGLTIGGLFGLLAVINFIIITWATIDMNRRVQKFKRQQGLTGNDEESTTHGIKEDATTKTMIVVEVQCETLPGTDGNRNGENGETGKMVPQIITTNTEREKDKDDALTPGAAIGLGEYVK